MLKLLVKQYEYNIIYNHDQFHLHQVEPIFSIVKILAHKKLKVTTVEPSVFKLWRIQTLWRIMKG